MDFEPHTWLTLGKYTGAGIALGLGGVGAAVGMGNAAAQANEAIMRQPKVQSEMLRTMLIGQAVSESTGIYSLVVALLMLFVI